jgi:hypothetical protein
MHLRVEVAGGLKFDEIEGPPTQYPAALSHCRLSSGFTPESKRDSRLWVYERNSDKVFRLIPDEAALLQHPAQGRWF